MTGIRTYLIPFMAGVVLAVALDLVIAFLGLQPWQFAPANRWLAPIASWLEVLSSVLPGLLVGVLCIKRPMLIGFLAAFAASCVLSYITFHRGPWSPFHLFAQLNTAGLAGVIGAVAAGAGFWMGSNNSFKPKPLRGSA